MSITNGSPNVTKLLSTSNTGLGTMLVALLRRD